jgi:hypothetical protein
MVLEVGKQIPMEFKSRDDMVDRMCGRIEVVHEMLVEANDDMVRQRCTTQARSNSGSASA